MMTPDQVKTITAVLRKLSEYDTREMKWTDIDEAISMLSWISDEQLLKEAETQFTIHNTGSAKCSNTNPNHECFVPIILDAVQAIIDLNKTTKQLHCKNRYILEYYLALSCIDEISI